MPNVLHPELIGGLPVTGDITERFLEAGAEQIHRTTFEPTDVSVVIRSKDESERVEALLQDVHAQQFGGEVEIILVDNESRDNTVAMATTDYGATVRTIPRCAYTHSRAMNTGMKAASHELVFMTVGHALLSNTASLQAGARHFKNPAVAGVFSYPSLPGRVATRVERMLLAPDILIHRSPHQVTKARIGAMAATGSMYRRSAWEECGRFDESITAGGEDTVLARRMLAKKYALIHDPLLRVHHTHGLTLRDGMRKRAKWWRVLAEANNS